LPDSHGLEILQKLKSYQKYLPVIILTGDSAAEQVVKAMQLGSYDYLVKPIDRNKLTTAVKNAVERFRMSLKLAQLERETSGKSYGMLGNSFKMQELFREIDRVSASDISVLIHGESGTGKELVASAIHQNSGRKEGNFVAINCAAIPESLQESELFGHEKGAYTGADKRRAGRFELADEGTLFLDEIAELSLPVQAKLLRVLQEKTFSRLGSSNETKSDFRVIAATHKNLADEVEKGKFREDLFFRIAVYELDVPPLRERDSDIELLANSFLIDFCRKNGRNLTLSPETLKLLKNYDFPGNVRELQNYMQRAVVAASTNIVQPNDLPKRVFMSFSSTESSRSETIETPALAVRTENFTETPLTLEEVEKIVIESAITRNEGNLSNAVRELGIGRTTLYRKLKQYGIENASS
jgi:DNA-binding NtrC family response regulator